MTFSRISFISREEPLKGKPSTAESLLQLHKTPKSRPPRHDLRKLRVIESDPDLQDTTQDPDLELET